MFKNDLSDLFTKNDFRRNRLSTLGIKNQEFFFDNFNFEAYFAQQVFNKMRKKL